MPNGTTIRTIGQAAEYATGQSKKVTNTEPWQRAAKALHGPRSTAARSFSWLGSTSIGPYTATNRLQSEIGKARRATIGERGSWRDR